jgi:DNA-binding Xre family transcriptional regulator
VPGWLLFTGDRHVFRRSLAEAAARHLPAWAGRLTPHVLRHFCASQLYLGGMSLFAIQELLGHAWTGTTARYIHVHGTHVEDAWVAGQQRAANRGIWKASELQRLLAGRGLVISAGKMSGLWSGQPNTVRLDELDVICAVLGCDVGELLLPEPVAVPASAAGESSGAVAEARAVTPRSRTGRSLPPR